MKKILFTLFVWLSYFVGVGHADSSISEVRKVLASHKWRLDHLKLKNGEIMSPAEVCQTPPSVPYLTFTAKGELRGYICYNNIYGDYRIAEKGSVKLSDVMTTYLGCSDCVGFSENEYLSLLSHIKKYSINNNSLTLSGDEAEFLFSGG